MNFSFFRSATSGSFRINSPDLHLRGIVLATLMLTGITAPSKAQSLLTDQPSSKTLLFEQGVPLPPTRPLGFKPIKPAEAPKPAAAPQPADVPPDMSTSMFQTIPLPPIRPKDLAGAGPSGVATELPVVIKNPEPNAAKGPNPSQPADLPEEQVIAKASAVLSEMTEFQAPFTQIDASGRKTTGQLAVARPGRLRFDYDPPSELVVIADGNNVGVIDRKLKTRDIYSLFLTPLKFLLREKIDLGNDITVIGVRSDPDAYVIITEDRSTFAGTSRIALSFDKRSLKIKQWTVTDPQGYDTTVILGPLDTETEPDGDLFVIPEKVG